MGMWQTWLSAKGEEKKREFLTILLLCSFLPQNPKLFRREDSLPFFLRFLNRGRWSHDHSSPDSPLWMVRKPNNPSCRNGRKNGFWIRFELGSPQTVGSWIREGMEVGEESENWGFGVENWGSGSGKWRDSQKIEAHFNGVGVDHLFILLSLFQWLCIRYLLVMWGPGDWKHGQID